MVDYLVKTYGAGVVAARGCASTAYRQALRRERQDAFFDRKANDR